MLDKQHLNKLFKQSRGTTDPNRDDPNLHGEANLK